MCVGPLIIQETTEVLYRFFAKLYPSSDFWLSPCYLSKKPQGRWDFQTWGHRSLFLSGLQEALLSPIGFVFLHPCLFLHPPEKTIGDLPLRQSGGLFPRAEKRQQVSWKGQMRCDAGICLRTEYEAMVERLRVTCKSGGDSGPSHLSIVFLSPFFSLAELPNLLKLLPASHRVIISL